MLKLENTEVLGWEHAIRGMRNPYSIEGAENNSWDKSDSAWTINDFEDVDEESGDVGRVLYKDPFVTHIHYELGKNDADLMMRLANGGPVHAKYRRMIAVYVDITAPLYWWKEFDTYKVGTVANSCSTMHKIAAKRFERDDFSHEHLMDGGNYILNATIDMLNKYRGQYLDSKDKTYWWQMIQLLPSSYNQRRTVMLNYEVLANIYKSRRNHKLDEWHTFCEWIESLPYSELITGHNISETSISHEVVTTDTHDFLKKKLNIVGPSILNKETGTVHEWPEPITPKEAWPSTQEEFAKTIEELDEAVEAIRNTDNMPFKE